EEYSDYMMQDPADYYYGVIWNKFYKKDIILQNQLKMDPELKWCEDFIFNMEYILRCERIFPLKVPTYYYVKTAGSLVWSGMNLANIVRMKLSVIEYYRSFYKAIYHDMDYAIRQPAIYGFLFDFAKDEFTFMGAKKLGEENVPVRLKEGSGENVFTKAYYLSKELDRRLHTAGLPFNLELREMKTLACLMDVEKREIGEVADFLGENKLKTTALLEKLALKNYVQLKLEQMSIRVLPGEAAEPVFKAILQAQEDFKESNAF
ncbi:MAG: glycosyl transferase family 2, partial [Lachnospiraceae bacterium]|nr:glycosyl transferase family 2 [Lachnospiraceae bacterium]